MHTGTATVLDVLSWNCWIRICIGITDPDPGDLKLAPKMNKIIKFLFLNIFNSIYNGLHDLT